MSVKGCGKNFPDPAGAEKLDDGVFVPCGKSQDNSLHFKSSLLYNEVAMCVGPGCACVRVSGGARVISVKLASLCYVGLTHACARTDGYAWINTDRHTENSTHSQTDAYPNTDR